MTPSALRAPRPTLSAFWCLAAGLFFAACDSNNDTASSTPTTEPVEFSHAEHFAANPYVGPNMNVACIGCHGKEVQDLLHSGHWNWSGLATNLVGFETEEHGKKDFLNNFCIAVPTNEGRCTQCHVGTGYDDPNYDFGDPAGVDCLVCHDTTGTYAKAPKTAGMPVTGLDWQAIAAGIGKPGRANCGACHYKAGGGDNVKHGDLAVNLNDTTRDYDVHMGVDGGNMPCIACHYTDGEHGLGGMPVHSVDEGHMFQCADCHETPHADNGSIEQMVTMHPTLSCQVCHIPAIARFRTTKVEWYWATAGDQNRTPVAVGDGRFDYNVLKGDFVWANNVRPVLRRHDGTWKKMIVGVNDTYTGTPSPANPVVVAEPAASKDPLQSIGVKIYPFKKMIGNQVADTVNKRIMVPHLFGTKGGEHPYWGTFDWDLALQDASAKLGIPYSGTYGFVDTAMYLTVNHEVAPKEQALGRNGCSDCHGNTASGPIIDWGELGRTDPLASGTDLPEWARSDGEGAGK